MLSCSLGNYVGQFASLEGSWTYVCMHGPVHNAAFYIQYLTFINYRARGLYKYANEDVRRMLMSWSIGSSITRSDQHNDVGVYRLVYMGGYKTQ